MMIAHYIDIYVLVLSEKSRLFQNGYKSLMGPWNIWIKFIQAIVKFILVIDG